MKKKFKKLSSLLLVAIVFCTSLMGCGGQSGSTSGSGTASTGTSSGKKWKVGMTSGLRVEYGANVEAALDQLAKDSDIEMVGYYNCNGDFQKHFDHIASFQQMGVDFIIMFTQDMSISPEYIKAANGIPIIFLNNKPTQEAFDMGNCYYVGCDESISGLLGGQYVAEKMKAANKDTINYALLMGAPGMETTTARAEGNVKGLEESGLKLVEVFRDYTEWDRESAIEKITPILGTGKQIDAILCSCGEIALGAIEALKTANRLDEVIVTSIDGISAEFEAIKNGELGMTAYVSPEVNAKTIFNQITKYLNGEEIEQIIENPYGFADIENVEEVVASMKNGE